MATFLIGSNRTVEERGGNSTDRALAEPLDEITLIEETDLYLFRVFPLRAHTPRYQNCLPQ